MNTQIEVSAELLAHLEFQPTCHVGHRPDSDRQPCQNTAAWVVERHVCCVIGAHFFTCDGHMAEVRRRVAVDIRERCSCGLVLPASERYLNWTRL